MAAVMVVQRLFGAGGRDCDSDSNGVEVDATSDRMVVTEPVHDDNQLLQVADTDTSTPINLGDATVASDAYYETSREAAISSPSPSSAPMASRLSDEAAAFLQSRVKATVNDKANDGEWELLVRANEQLRGQVDDLTGALKARDLEIAALQDRCRFLTNAMAQQDATIAKIYAVASPTTMQALQQPQQDQQQDNATEQKKPSPSPVPTPAVGVVTKPKSLLNAAIERILNPPASSSSSSSSSTSTTTTTTTAPSSSSSSSQRHRRMSLFDDDPVDMDATSPSNSHLTSGPSSSSSCSSTLSSKSNSGRNFERRESCASEEDFVKSAGFLRKPRTRRTSGRLSISDFGLLDNHQDEEDEEGDGADQDEAGQQEEGDGEDHADNQQEDEQTAIGGRPPTASGRAALLGRSMSEDCSSKRRNRSNSRTGSSSSASSSSHRNNLFADIDAAKAAKSKSKKSNSSNQDEAAATGTAGASTGSADVESDEQEMSYAEFLEKLRRPSSRDLLDTIRLFLASILGPRGDGRAPRTTDFVDYDFYGNHEFRRRCTYFFQRIEELLSHHPVWRHASEATLAKARDSIEKYVMDKLAEIAMNQLDECGQWKEEDTKLLDRMDMLSFITPDMLEIKPCMRNEVVWSMAEDELRRINSFRSPGDKINCIVRCCSIIFSVLNLTRGDNGSRPGADDFLPVFIYIVLHSKIPRLVSNCEYIAAYRNPNDLMSKAGYCFVNLRSAIEFLSVVDGSMLSISPEDFSRLYAAAEQRKLTAATK